MANLVRTRERRELTAARVRVLSALIGLGLATVAGAYWVTQGIHGPEYREEADNNRLRRLPISAPRGVVYDREGRPLAENVPSYNLLLEPQSGLNVKKSLEFAATVLDTDAAELRQLYDKNHRERPVDPALIAENLTLSQVARFELASLEHPEFDIDVQQVRLYRQREQTAHVLGYLSEVTQQELQSGAYRRGDMIGRRGIERQYESVLRGEDGERTMVVDIRGRAVDELERVPPRAGTPLQLAIDLDYQQAAQRALQDKVGAVVAMDPRTGEILALASAPGYDPNLFARRLRPDDWMRLVNDPLKPLQNRAIQNAMSPGSTFKTVMAIAGLTEHVIDDHTTFYCPGSAVFYGRRFRCWRPQGHGAMDVRNALKNSCDVFFYNVGQRLGIERIAKYARLFGLGQISGIDLPGEKEGLVPDPTWSQKVRHQPWYLGETISVAIGQGPILATPLQMAVMTSAIANGARRPVPHLAQETGAPTPVTGIGAAAFRAVREGMQMVVDGGTGNAGHLDDLAIAGKTGSVQVIAYHSRIKYTQQAFEQRDHAWFTSFAPVNDPQIVVSVFIEHGGAGSAAAAPVAKEVYEQFVRKHPEAQRPTSSPGVQGAP